MKYLYYCNSAYQLLNVLNLHYHRNHGFEDIDNYEADLLILNVFKGADEIKEIIKKKNIFNKVMFIDKAEKNSGHLHIIKSFSDIAFPGHHLKEKYGLDKRELRYDVLTVPKFSPVLGAIYQLNKNARLQLYDEGLAMYFVASDLIVSRSRSYKLLYKLFNYGRDFLNFESVYLTHPDFFTGDCPEKVRKVPAFDKGYLSEIKDMFKSFAGDSQEYSKKLWWFSQSMFEDEEVLKILEHYKEDLLYCPHPRYPTADERFDISKSDSIWEIRAMNIPDIENKCLISIHSTALISPKLLFDYEPYIIFVYRLINFDYEWDFDHTILPFLKLYSHPEKIMIPSSFEELEDCIKFVLNSKD